MTIEELKNKKTTLGLTNEMIAASAGIPLSTEERRRSNMSGIIPDRRKSDTYENLPETCGTVMEPAAGYNLAPEKTPEKKKKDGEYTLDDYYALPDERRVELIDGVFYDMSAPAVIHQKILGELHILFRECMDAHEGECEVYLSPCDVRLDCDNKTMVQPDLLVICGPYDLGAKRFEGAPDLVLEILSPSTRSKDMLLKLYKYQNAGVKEYWIVDPDRETVMVYYFRDDNFYPEKYDFDSVIPIHISDGQCSIDFSRVNRALKKVRSAGKE